MATPLSTPTLFDFFMIFFRFLELNFQTKVEQERTLTDGIHLSTYSMFTKFDILNHDGFLISRGCISVSNFGVFGFLAITENLHALKH